MNIWNFEECARICALAGMEQEWNDADGETFEHVVFKAAGALGIDML